MINMRIGAVVFGLVAMASQGVWAQDVETGEELYMHYCATCHGIGATGQGPMAGVLLVQPTNLKALAGEDGIFPTARVAARIDGRDPLVSHGSPMPVYGPYFEGRDTAIKTHEGQPILTSQPIVDLVAYLRLFRRVERSAADSLNLGLAPGDNHVALAPLSGQGGKVKMLSQHSVQSSGALRLRIERAAAHVFFHDGALLFVPVR